MKNNHSKHELSYWSELAKERLKAYYDKLLPSLDTPPHKLNAAMRYTLENGGKRLRPMLVYMTADMLGGSLDDADAPAASVELIHTYSLIHDDLPAMDDDDLRRGKPSCHKAFDEATAILTGDALQALAFEILATPSSNLPATIQLAMVQMLAQASGMLGMCKGQALDIEATKQTISLAQLEQMHHHKTGALIKASVLLGALASNKASASDLELLDKFADRVGLAFQVKDDVLDVIGDTASLGKPQGSDQALGKATYTELLGLEKASSYAKQLCEEGKDFLSSLQHNSTALCCVADYINQRVA